MNENIKAIWLQIEKEKAEFLGMLEHWTPEQLQFKPDGGWNAIQVMDHIITSEFGTLSYMKKKTQAKPEELTQAEDDSKENSDKLNNALISDRQWKAPDILPHPTDEDGFETKMLQWSKVRQSFFAFLDELAPDYYEKQIFKHPFAGRLNLEQTLGFVLNHIVHHKHQIHRIQEAMK